MTNSTATGEGSDLGRRVADGDWLDAEAGLRLLETRDIHSLGEWATTVRQSLHGDDVFYNINQHINYTNYCVLRCRFCSFYEPYSKGTPEGGAGYELSVDDVVARARAAYSRGATEVHIVGGLHPTLPFSYYTDMLSDIRASCPHLHIKAFTAIEIIHFTRIAKPRMSIAEVLTELRSAGLDSLPGGGAEIFDERVHKETFAQKVGEAQWFDVHRAAHELGIYSNATMLYGHVESPAERVTHLLKLREHQAESLKNCPAHFNCIVPLSFVPAGSDLADLPGPSGLDDLRTLAATRLLCPNIPHVKAFWPMLSPKLAQVSLGWGVNDLDGTVVYYGITKREPAAHTHQELSVPELHRLILEAGCTPVERDSLYRRVRRIDDGWSVEGADWSVACGLQTADCKLPIVD